MKLYMLDTDTSSYIIKERLASVLREFDKLSMEQICISVVTYAELLYGVERSSSKRINRQVVDDFVKHLTVYDWDERAAAHYGQIRTSLERAGTPIGAMDMMIAAHARSLHAIVVTNNERHFGRVANLKTVNWVME